MKEIEDDIINQRLTRKRHNEENEKEEESNNKRNKENEENTEMNKENDEPIEIKETSNEPIEMTEPSDDESNEEDLNKRVNSTHNEDETNETICNLRNKIGGKQSNNHSQQTILHPRNS